jgi:hypothetical protein
MALANIPITNILVKGTCARKHIRHIRHLTNIPTTNVLIKDGCGMKHIRHKHSNVGITVAANTFTDVVGNTNTTIAKNTTTISNLKDQIDIKTDLTHSFCASLA